MSSWALKIIMAALLLLRMHACNARHTFDLVSYTIKDDVADRTKLLNDDLDLRGFPVFKDMNDTPSDDVSIETLDKTIARPVKEIQGLKAKPRSMLEIEAHNDNNNKNEIKEQKDDANEGEPVEDAVVMDYVNPHRKSPIHNHH